MRLIREITLDGRAVAVKELTVGEIRQWLKELEAGQLGDVIGGALFADLTLADLQRFTDLNPVAIDALAPSELREVIAAIKEVNADFFLLRDRLVQLGQAIAQQGVVKA